MARYKPTCHNGTNGSGDYTEVWYVQSAIRVLWVRRNHNGILNIRIIVTLLCENSFETEYNTLKSIIFTDI
jgi:hypothetical protein